MRNLFTPWRYAYLSGGGRSRRCVFCKARDSRDDRSELVAHRGRYNFVILNRYPYNSGHLMIAPNEHLSSLARSSPAQLREMMLLAARCERALRRIYRMDGLNLGMNLGESAGAGILGHFHLHLVPRWKGDTNFITVVGSTRVTPELLQDTFQKVRAQLRRPLKPGSKPARPLRRKAS